MNFGRPPEEDPDDLVTVGRFIDPMAAQFARSLLEADGLACFVQGGGLGSLLPTTTLYPILLQVGAADAGRAGEILDEIPASGRFADEPDCDESQRPSCSGDP